jgi:uncharacterized protein (TIGR02646 family)
MIRVERSPCPEIKVYRKKTVKLPDGTPCTLAERELHRALIFFADEANFAGERKLTKQEFKFDVYGDRELRKALEALFNNKCAYCESAFKHVSPTDVEHFRPKSEIETGTKVLRPGYYWLAAEWTNLLASCIDCNRKRWHEVPGQVEEVRLGKLAQFPLSDETQRVRKGAVDAEEAARLLLNPCEDHPEEHLTFDDEGLIHARSNNQNLPSKKGEVSITVYALQRKYLVEARVKTLNNCKLLFEQLTHLVTLHNGLTSQALRDSNATQIAKVRDALREMFQASQPYLGMLRQWVRDAIGRGEFARLVQFGIEPASLI